MKMSRIIMIAAATAVILAIPGTALAATAGSARTSSAPAPAQMTVGAQQQAASQTAGVATLASATTHSTAARPPATQESPSVNPAECVNTLKENDYPITGLRGIGLVAICYAAAVAAQAPHVHQQAVFAACIGSLGVGGVDILTAIAACTYAVYA